MRSKEYGGWQITIFWLAVVAAAGIGAFSVGWSWRDAVETRENFRLALDVMIAFGTVGTAAAAVVVPLYQNWDRRREQQYNQLLADWALAEEVHRLSARLVAIGNTMKDPLGLPSEVEMVNLQSQLSIAKQATKDRVGLLIVGDLLNEAVALLGIRVRYDNLATRTDAMGLAIYASTSRSFTDERVERLESLHKQTYRWMERIILQLEALGLDAPGVVKGAGSASLSVSASADGRVQRS